MSKESAKTKIKYLFKKISRWSLWKWIIGLLSIAILMILNYAFIHSEYGRPGSPGAFGDSFGGVGALFSGIALIGVFITLSAQQKQLQEQQSFLARAEMNDTFFELLKIFEKVQSKICSNFDENRKSAPIHELFHSIQIDSNKSVEAIFKSFESKHTIVLDSYFRTLKYMLKFLEANPLEDDKTRLYSNLLRTQISPEEAGLIFINIQYHATKSVEELKSKKKLIDLVQHYKLLASIRNWSAVDESLRLEIDKFIDPPSQ